MRKKAAARKLEAKRESRLQFSLGHSFAPAQGLSEKIRDWCKIYWCKISLQPTNEWPSGLISEDLSVPVFAQPDRTLFICSQTSASRIWNLKWPTPNKRKIIFSPNMKWGFPVKSASTRRKQERVKKSDAQKLAAKRKGKIRPALPPPLHSADS